MSYGANHKRVYRWRGKATEQQCVSCSAPAREWAQLHTEDGSDPWADYVPMCRRCHFRYDRVAERVAQKIRGKRQSTQAIERRRVSLSGTLRRNNTSGVPGVHWHSQKGRWRVQVHKVSGGTYTSLAEATAARDTLARHIYGPGVKTYGGE